jgi:hypothetical protein
MLELCRHKAEVHVLNKLLGKIFEIYHKLHFVKCTAILFVFHLVVQGLSCADHNWVFNYPSQHEHWCLYRDRPDTTRWIVLTQIYLSALRTKRITMHMNKCNLLYVTNILSCDLFDNCISALYLHVSNTSSHNYSYFYNHLPEIGHCGLKQAGRSSYMYQPLSLYCCIFTGINIVNRNSPFYKICFNNMQKIQDLRKVRNVVCNYYKCIAKGFNLLE